MRWTLENAKREFADWIAQVRRGGNFEVIWEMRLSRYNDLQVRPSVSGVDRGRIISAVGQWQDASSTNSIRFYLLAAGQLARLDREIAAGILRLDADEAADLVEGHRNRVYALPEEDDLPF